MIRQSHVSCVSVWDLRSPLERVPKTRVRSEGVKRLRGDPEAALALNACLLVGSARTRTQAWTPADEEDVGA